MKAAWSANAASRRLLPEIAAQLAEMVEELAVEDGVVPKRASEIRAKTKRKKVFPDDHVVYSTLTRETRRQKLPLVAFTFAKTTSVLGKY